MYCKKCGKEIDEDVKYCPYCGANQEENLNSNSNNTNNNDIFTNTHVNLSDSPSGWWGVLGFLSPVIALILYLVWKDEKPRTAKLIGKWGIIGVIVEVVFVVLYLILVFIILGNANQGLDYGTLFNFLF